jgi:hypothetical protein
VKQVCASWEKIYKHYAVLSFPLKVNQHNVLTVIHTRFAQQDDYQYVVKVAIDVKAASLDTCGGQH